MAAFFAGVRRVGDDVTGARGFDHATEGKHNNDCDGPGPVAIHVATYHEFVAGLYAPPTHSMPLCNNPEGRPGHPDEPHNLSKPVGDILDETIQRTLPLAPTCGPTPMQYRDTLRALWSVLSGQGWAAHPQHAEAYMAARHMNLFF